MKEKHDEAHATEGRKTVWGLLAIGILILLAGLFIRIPGMSVSLPKTEILTGTVLVIGAVASLVIAS